MKVFITAASRQGATTEIAVRTGRILADAGIDATVAAPDTAASLAGYDAFVIGSAVRFGRWLEPARRFLAEHRDELVGRPVWLFSSGPVGDGPVALEETPEIIRLRADLDVRDHRVFNGRFTRDGLNLFERALAGVMHTAEADYRPWGEIDAWARDIARQLGGVIPLPA